MKTFIITLLCIPSFILSCEGKKTIFFIQDKAMEVSTQIIRDSMDDYVDEYLVGKFDAYNEILTYLKQQEEKYEKNHIIK